MQVFVYATFGVNTQVASMQLTYDTQIVNREVMHIAQTQPKKC